MEEGKHAEIPEPGFLTRYFEAIIEERDISAKLVDEIALHPLLFRRGE